ncbi:tRNA (guanine-N7-)-methyltransferase [Rhodoligotrophos appendicifer]|uniref:tRNA (guanosine(46)-N7)-methyltransferase TrmB n=1 Tax=Rhodoligotrophos appendicifer TaxID=987056 RepID=UPI001FE75747|nr:tRNA (guanosine(46)-N7)-methyltransferase TrmB [Rhodoligotrophos appendicifer]
MAELLPRLRVSLDHLDDPRSLFPNPVREIWLEIGFGGGEHLAWQARQHPDVGFIGVEPFVNGVAKLLTVADAEGLQNIRVYDQDARELLSALPEASIGRAFILFPDPWHKVRHHKRRIVNRDTLGDLARIMTPGSVLRIGSDIPGYVRWIMMHARQVPRFAWTAESATDWRVRPDDWPITRYEQKAEREGRRSVYMSFRRQNAVP